jgi:hypothetical protein
MLTLAVEWSEGCSPKEALYIYYLVKEVANLIKLYEAVGELYARYREAIDTYEAYMQQRVGRLLENRSSIP